MFRDVARIEASAMPEPHKSAKKAGARRDQAAYRFRRRRLALDATHDDVGNTKSSVEEIGAEMLRRWRFVFEQRPVDLGV